MHLRFDLRAALIAMAAGVIAVPAMAEDVTLTIENMSGADLTEFYASPVGTESWGANLLGAMIVAASNGPVTIAGTQGCAYDLRMVFADGDVLEDSADICANASYTIQ